MAVIQGTAGDDVLNGTANDPANGSGTLGDDTIFGLAGNDRINGRGGIDTIDGGAGDDLFLVTTLGPVVRAENSTYEGGDGADTLDMTTIGFDLTVNIQNVTNISAAAGASLTAANIETLILGSGADLIRGTGFFGQPAIRQLFLGAGNDVYDGGGGSGSMVDRPVTLDVYSGPGRDQIGASSGSLYGDDGDDVLDPAAPGARLFAGSDVLRAAARYGAVETPIAAAPLNPLIRTIDGGFGIDTLLATAGAIVDLAAGRLRDAIGTELANLVAIEKVVDIYGGRTIIGSSADDVFVYSYNTLSPGIRITVDYRGGGGSDVLDVGPSRGAVDGGSGNDTIYIARMTDARTIGGLASGLLLTVEGGSGQDTARFVYAFGDVAVDSPVGTRYITLTHQPSVLDVGVYRLAGVERLVFSDLTIDLEDGSPLVDDLSYLGRYRDVAAARLDSDDHYAQYGWRESRDPNAYFSTSNYLGLNDDVRSARLNPLDHYDRYGWREGRDASVGFDTTLYLLHNPDVKAAGLNPLAHFLQYGRAEGRTAYAAIGSRIDADGFDAQYYLLANPDVAAAAQPAADRAVFAAEHYTRFGWREGRDPNAVFDTDGYLAAYADVRAAGLDPLDHYAQYGWKEGRDPSAAFDTKSYLTAYADVARAGVNPLVHYLESGVYELRSAFADGRIEPI